MKIVTVIPLQKGAWKENLTYFTAQDVSNGNIVVIPLRSKKILGLVIEVEDASSQKTSIKGMSFDLKKIIEVKESSIFLSEYINTAREASRYFATSKNNGITSMLPAPIRENYDEIVKFIKHHPITTSSSTTPIKSIKSEKLLLQASQKDRISFYKTFIRGSFAEKKSVFMVLPTEHDIEIFKNYLSRGIEKFTFVIHGGLSSKNIIKEYEKIITSDHSVLILGTATFLSIPRRDIKTIIIEHESSTAYKMIGKPHFDLRFFTELFATKIGAKLILSDTLLRFETIGRKDEDNLLPVHPMQFRIDFNGNIEITNPNRKNSEPENSLELSKSKEFKIFSEKTVAEIRNSLVNKKSVFVFSLRKGLATMTICQDCKNTINCQKCGAPLVLYSSHKGQQRVFVCNRCEESMEGETSCVSCGSWNLKPLGVGTDTVYEEIENIFKLDKIKIFKLDKESAKTSKGAEKIVEEFEENPGSILIGTEMAFFYLKNKISLSIISSFDSLWSIPSFKMGERIIQIILSIIERTDKKIIIQTKNEEDSSVLAIKSRNLLSFVREEIEDRKNMDYPPFKCFIKITYSGDKINTLKSRKILEDIFKEYNPEIFNAFIMKQKDKYFTNALIKINPKKWSLSEISTGSSINEHLLTRLLSLPPSFTVLVDPEDLL